MNHHFIAVFSLQIIVERSRKIQPDNQQPVMGMVKS